MKTFITFLALIATTFLVGCDNTPNATTALKKAKAILEACGDKAEMQRYALEGLIIIESKSNSNIPLDEDEAEIMGILFSSERYDEKCGN